VTADMAIALGAAFDNDPADWLRLDAMHRLARAQDRGVSDVERRANLYRLAPIRDMQRRGWIKDTTDIAELEAELKRFFGVSSLDKKPALRVATKRSEPEEP